MFLKSLVVLLSLSVSLACAESTTCADTSNKPVQATYENATALNSTKSFTEVINNYSYTDPIFKQCIVSRSGSQPPYGLLLKAQWDGGIASISGYDSLHSLITIGVDNPPSEATNRHIMVFVKADSEPIFRKLLDAVLDKSDASSLVYVDYPHPQTPNQKQQVVLMWNDFTSKNPNTMKILGLSYQYHGIQVINNR